MTQPPPPDPSASPAVGPLAVEAALLLDVVADRLVSMKRTTESGAADGSTEASSDAGGRCPECGSVQGASCTACPLCRFMGLLRGERPEATAKLVDGALMIIRTLRSLVPDPPEATGAAPAAPTANTPEPTAGQQGPAGPHTPSGAHGSARRGGLEHIDIS